MEEIFCPSKTGFHEAPTSVLFHTPPPTPPKYQVAGSPGTPLTATTRPPRNGPICRHFMPPISSGLTSAAVATSRQQSKRASRASIAADDGKRRMMNLFSSAVALWGTSYINVSTEPVGLNRKRREIYEVFHDCRRDDCRGVDQSIGWLSTTSDS